MYYNLELSLQYAKRNWFVYPVWGVRDNKCLCKGMRDCKPGKHPYGLAVPHGHLDASCEEKLIHQWFPTTSVNVGINVEASRLLIIDFDVRKGELETLERWQAEYGAMPHTPTAKSGSGGPHYYFNAHPLITQTNNHTLPGVDVIANTGVIAPPSMHEFGERYEWLTPLDTPLANCPDWLLSLITLNDKPIDAEGQKNPMQGRLERPGGITFDTLGSLHAGKRNAELNRCIGSMLANGFTPKQILDAGERWADKQEPPYSLSDLRAKVNDFARKEDAKRLTGVCAVSITEQSGDLNEDNELTRNEFVNSSIRSRTTPVIQDAFYGLIGETLKAIEPQTEADSAGVLFALLTAFGNCVGHSPYVSISARRHYANLFACLHGKTGCKKGEAWHICRLLFASQTDWLANCLGGHFGSGEGLVERVCDDRSFIENGKEVLAPGVADKRLMIVDEEFRNTLTLCRRPDSTLTGFLLKAWDGVPLSVMNRKQNALRSTDHHISVLGNITTNELADLLGKGAEAFNGFANRFLWIGVKRSKIITFPKPLAFYDLPERWASIVAIAKQIGEVSYDDAFKALYAEVCPLLVENEEDETLSVNALERARPYVFRLAMLYALSDAKNVISKCHLRAALACWRLNVEGCKAVFGNTAKSKTPSLTERLLTLLRSRPGLSRTEMHDAFSRNVKADALNEALATLEANQLVYSRIVEKIEHWYPTDSDKGITGANTNERIYEDEFVNSSLRKAGSDKSVTGCGVLYSETNERMNEITKNEFVNSSVRSFVEPPKEQNNPTPVERSTQDAVTEFL